MLLALALFLQSTTVQVLTLDEMKAKADVVVHAIVVDQRVVDGATYTTLEVIEGKGASKNERLDVYQAGVLDGVHVKWIAGAHKFRVGEELVFFGERATVHGNPVVVALTLGYGLFVADAGFFTEDAGGAVDVLSGKPTVARTLPLAELLR